MFNKKRKGNCGSVLSDEFVPASLPEKGNPDLTWFTTSEYSLNTPGFIKTCINEADEELNPLIQMSDKFTIGHVCDSFVHGAVEHVRNKHQNEVAMHEFQAKHIASSVLVREEELDRSIAESESKISELDSEIASLKGKHSMFDLTVGGFHIPVPAIVTILAMVIDACLNYSYFASILYQSRFMLIISVIAMSVMSDASMFFLGMFNAQRKEGDVSKITGYVVTFGLVGAFILSIVTSVMVRFGSMDTTYGFFDASGQFVGKESYSLAEYGITAITAFLTTVTGLISLAVSADANGHLVTRRRKLEKKRSDELAHLDRLKAERKSLELSPDSMDRDTECRKAAEDNLTALEKTMKLHVRKMLAVFNDDSSYLDAMSESADTLFDDADSGTEQIKNNNIEISKGAV